MRRVAEEEGFEPPVSCPTTVFKTAAFDLSATPPQFPRTSMGLGNLVQDSIFKIQEKVNWLRLSILNFEPCILNYSLVIRSMPPM